MLSEHDLLTADECNRACDIVHSLKDHWVNRSGGFLPFFTLGAASYLDTTKEDETPYLQAALRYNPILEANFPLIYERLVDTLSGIFNVPVAYAKNYGRPGFHIFLAAKCFENPIASIHFDLQYKNLKWEFENIDYDNPISFTCPIALPKGSGGLNYWDIGSESKDLSKDEVDNLRKTKEQHYFPYHLGKLVLHHGLTLHQIAPSQEMHSNDERITLQGHGLMCDGILRLYW